MDPARADGAAMHRTRDAGGGVVAADGGEVDAARPAGRVMAERPDTGGDRVIDERRFQLGGGIDLSAFMVGDDAAAAETAGAPATPPAIATPPALPAPATATGAPSPHPAGSPDETAASQAAADDAREIDRAVGDILDPFVAPGTPIAGDVSRDGTVQLAPEEDSVTQLAVEGEQRLHWSLMVTMVVTWSLIGFLVGTVLPPLVGALGLTAMAVFGFWLGERWIPRRDMRLLGVTWVIISMKLLYGLALDVHHWGWLGEGESAAWALGGLLIALVAANVWVAHHHDDDAIAAQATLVLLAIASAAGAVGGELGIAGLIAVATLLLHALALQRHSGNLASLGIAATNLWIGMHAIVNEFSIGQLTILPLEDPRLLLSLLLAVNALNAAMAARFADQDNWFSAGARVLGLGKPGLWGVSVGIGLVGALLAVSANRLETGYALAQVATLLGAFGASYLVVRGEHPLLVALPLLAGLPGLLSVLFLPDVLDTTVLDRSLPLILGACLAGGGHAAGLLYSRSVRTAEPHPQWQVLLVAFTPLLAALAVLAVDPTTNRYAAWAALAAASTAVLLLDHQRAVSDQVLWIGSLVLVLLLTLLVPATADGDGGRALLTTLALLHVGTAWLAIRRQSPALAGVSVLTPWVWLLAFGLDPATRLFSVNWVPVEVEGWTLTTYLIVAALLQLPVNLVLGETGVNLAAKVVGLSEVGVHLRDSGLLVLWNLGLLAGLVGVVASSSMLSGAAVFLAVSVLLVTHVGAQVAGRRSQRPQVLLWSTLVVVLVLTFRHGMHAWWPWLVVALLGSLQAFGSPKRPERAMALLLGGVASVAVMWLVFEPSTPLLLGGIDPEAGAVGWSLLLVAAVAMLLYLPRAASFEELLLPALSAVGLLIVSVLVGLEDGVSWGAPFALLLFVASGAWLSAQGEIRSGMRSVARREERLERVELKRRLAAFVAEGGEIGALEAQVGATPVLSAGAADMAPALLSAPVAGAPAGVATAAASQAPGSPGTVATPAVLPTAGSATATVPDGAMVPATGTVAERVPGTEVEGAPAPSPSLAREDGRLRATQDAPSSIAGSVSTGGMQLVDPELVTLLDKQRKRRRRSASSGDLDLLTGDIHHRPVVVLTFLTATLLGVAGWAWLGQPGVAGALLLGGLVAAGFILLARWRAGSLQLSLPDVLGVELPIAWTMSGLALAVVAGRWSPTAIDTSDASDLLVLDLLLLIFGGLSLMGRRDLALRIPSTIAWIVHLLVAVRLASALFGALPWPLLVDPFDGDTAIWILPWVLTEVLLLAAVIGWDGIEGVRRRLRLPDVRGAAGRGIWPLTVAVHSWGPATLAAALLGWRRGAQWRQPAAVAFVVAAIPISWMAVAAWIPAIVDSVGWVTAGVGAFAIGAMAFTMLKGERTPWTSAWAWDAQILLAGGIVVARGGIDAGLVLALLTTSLAIWVAGVLQARRSMRVWGAVNLAAAWLAGLLGVASGASLAEVLVMLVATGLVLGIVTWLGQRDEAVLAEG